MQQVKVLLFSTNINPRCNNALKPKFVYSSHFSGCSISIQSACSKQKAWSADMMIKRTNDLQYSCRHIHINYKESFTQITVSAFKLFYFL